MGWGPELGVAHEEEAVGRILGVEGNRKESALGIHRHLRSDVEEEGRQHPPPFDYENAPVSLDDEEPIIAGVRDVDRRVQLRHGHQLDLGVAACRRRPGQSQQH